MSSPPDWTPEQLAEIARVTIGHYDANAESFWHGTRDHDVSQNRDALLRHIEAEPPFRLLDVGCGPGRDLAAFCALGHEPVGLDGSARFCAMARDYAGCEVIHADLLALRLPEASFDGVFCNAVLFHVPSQALPSVLGELWRALKPAGVLFCSNPRGHNDEGWSGARYGAFHDYERWSQLVARSGFDELEHYYRPPGLPRDQQPWLATVYRKVVPQERPTRAT
jgi:SAM-dependent methyltransferase